MEERASEWERVVLGRTDLILSQDNHTHTYVVVTFDPLLLPLIKARFLHTTTYLYIQSLQKTLLDNRNKNVISAWQEFNKYSINRRLSLSSQLIWKYWHANVHGLKDAILFIESKCRICSCKRCKEYLKGTEEAAVPCFILDFFRQNASHMSRNVIKISVLPKIIDKPIPRHRRFPSCLRSLKLLLLLICVKYESFLKKSSLERVLSAAHRLHRVEVQYLEHERRLLFCGMDLIQDLTEIHRQLEEDFSSGKCVWWNCYKANTAKLFDTLREQEALQLSHLLNGQISGRKSIDKYCYEDIPPMTLHVPLRAQNRKVVHY
ncbi:unnamed protein product [Lepeophtheirus salmonis]|uniref:(salmon louse) hypothetical protein n=1 Tax=Lepeophtheirus salmonis TaxID=72036 RepID=A0A7R8H4P5_LEPSM|nr:unnamed protein product [Lepeophtheirus salmonis]CAF2849519.1 unnamed protein product [Lepeophtheirus salmonis]